MELVLDASVVIKWFLPEPLAKKALQFRCQHLEGKLNLLAPSLLSFEIANALCTKSGIEVEVILSALEAFYFTNIQEVIFDKKLIQQTATLAKKYHITVYDASYLALAKQRSCPFITADKKLHRKVKSVGFIELLEE